uniref:Elongation factor P n=1 Tax=Aegilops tauschii TaxID=37682 RepID=N1QQF5_AEGTA
MQILRRNLLEASRRLSSLLHSPPPAAQTHAHAVATLSAARRDPSTGSLAATPWAATQRRGAKMLGSDVIKSHHSHQGRGGATIQVELRDVDTGNKIVERFRTDEALERVFVEDKPFTYLYQEGDNVALMEPNTFEQLEVSKELFGKNAAYLKDEMKVTVQFFDGRALSGSVPPRVTCTVVEAQPNAKGLTATPQYKRVLLDNGLTVLGLRVVSYGALFSDIGVRLVLTFLDKFAGP